MNTCWVWSGMPRYAQCSPKWQTVNISGKDWTILFICCMQLHIQGSCIVIRLFELGMVWHAQSSLERVEWFCWFFACTCLHHVGYPLKLPNLLFWAGIVRHRLSADQIVRCFKLRKLENYMRYQVDFLLPLKLQKICYFGLCCKILFPNQFAGLFYFWLVWLVNRNTGSPLLHCACFTWS